MGVMTLSVDKPHKTASSNPAIATDGHVTMTLRVCACGPCLASSVFQNRLGAQQTAYARLPHPNALQEKFY